MDLSEINKEITRLKILRIKLYGKDWQKHRKRVRVLNSAAEGDIKKYIRFFDEQMALKNINVGSFCKSINVDRNTYSSLKSSMCSYLTKRKIDKAILNSKY